MKKRLKGVADEARSVVKAGGYDYDTLAAYEKSPELEAQAEYLKKAGNEIGGNIPTLASGLALAGAKLKPIETVEAWMRRFGGHSDPDDLDTYIPERGNNYALSGFLDGMKEGAAGEQEKRFPLEAGGRNVASALYRSGMNALDYATGAQALGPVGGLAWNAAGWRRRPSPRAAM